MTKRNWQVINLTTGEIYKNAAAAAASIGVGASAMSNHLKGRCNTLGGCKFKRVDEDG